MIYIKKILYFIAILFLFTVSDVKLVSAYNDQLIIINKTTNKLAFYEDGKKLKEYSVATGKTSKLTPEGLFKVSVKWKCPIYYKTNNGGCTANNPLGPRWIGLDVPGTAGYTYGIHGTNAPWSIGTNASSGCIRMNSEKVKELFDLVNEGATVLIVKNNKKMDEMALEQYKKINKENQEIKEFKKSELKKKKELIKLSVDKKEKKDITFIKTKKMNFKVFI